MYENKKITLSTFKSFIKKYENHLYFMPESHFDSMTDGTAYTPKDERKFTELQRRQAERWDYRYAEERGRTKESVDDGIRNNKNTLGYNGIWLVGGSRDYFSAFDNDEYTGIHVYNCCGSYTIAIQKEKVAA